MYKAMIGLFVAVLAVFALATTAQADYWDDDVIDVYTPIDAHSMLDTPTLYDTRSTFSSQSDLFDFNTVNSYTPPSFHDNMSAFRLQSDLFDHNTVNSWTQRSFDDSWHQIDTRDMPQIWNIHQFNPGVRLIEFQQPPSFDFYHSTIPTYKPDPILRDRIFDRIRDMPAAPTFKPQPVRRKDFSPRG